MPVGRLLKRQALALAMQSVASISWVVSVFVYGDLPDWGAGDWLQFVAATAWTASNLATLPDVFAAPPGATVHPEVAAPPGQHGP